MGECGRRMLLAIAALLRAADENGAGLLAPKTAHHKAKAENLIVIFLTGGFSHVDTFDYKPALNRYHGQPVPSSRRKERRLINEIVHPLDLRPA